MSRCNTNIMPATEVRAILTQQICGDCGRRSWFFCKYKLRKSSQCFIKQTESGKIHKKLVQKNCWWKSWRVRGNRNRLCEKANCEQRRTFPEPTASEVVCINLMFMTGENGTHCHFDLCVSSMTECCWKNFALLLQRNEMGLMIWPFFSQFRITSSDCLTALVAVWQSFPNFSHQLYPLQIAWYLSASAQRFLLIARSASSVNRRNILLLHIVTISAANPSFRISSRNARIVFWIELAVQ